MQKSVLGKTGITVSRLCFGTLTMSPMQRNLKPSEGARLLLLAYDRGVNFLDTAEIYDNYEHIKLALKERPDYVVSTKCYAYDEKTALESWEKSVRSLGREYIDIFMLHEQESEHTLRGHKKAIAFFQKKKEQGYIGALGMSTHFIAGVEGALKHPLMDIIHPIFNEYGLGIVDGTIEQMQEIVQKCYAAGMGVLAMKPLGGGHLISRREQAFDFVLSKPYIHSVAMGMQSAAEVEYNCALCNGESTAPFEKSIDMAKRTLLIQNWCEGCGKCERACKNNAITLINGKATVDMSKCILCGYCAPGCPQFCIKVI